MQSILRPCLGVAALLSEVVEKPGDIFAPLPPATSHDRALQFDSGGLASLSGAIDWLFFDLAHKKSGTLVLLDVWLQAKDLKARRPAVESYLSDGSQIYYYLSLAALDPRKLAVLHKQISSFQVVGFFFPGGIDLSFEQRRQHLVPAGYVEQFAKVATTVYVSAYDQEAWVVWQSPENTPLAA